MNAKLSVVNLYQCENGFITNRRTFDYHYLLYVHEGHGAFKIGNTMYAAQRGDIFFCPAWTENRIYAAEENPFLLSGIEIAPGEHDAYIEKHLNEKLNLSAKKYLHGMICGMINQFLNATLYAREICNGMLIVLLYEMFALSQFGGGETEGGGRDIIEFIQENFDKKISHELLSERFHYHKNTVNNMLRKRCNMSLNQYLVALRVKRACELLSFGNKSVSETAELCGYSTEAFFCRQFKQKTGVTPLAYRNTRSGGTAEL